MQVLTSCISKQPNHIRNTYISMYSKRPTQQKNAPRKNSHSSQSNTEKTDRAYSKRADGHSPTHSDRHPLKQQDSKLHATYNRTDKNTHKRTINKRGAPQFDKNGSSPKQSKRAPIESHPTKTQPQTSTTLQQDVMRLNKYIAHAGICSRREADNLIAAGAIKVNGQVVTEMGYKVQPGDEVNYGGETLRGETLRYILLNKPKGFITTLDDPFQRDTVMQLVANACKERIYPVGRLDRNTTGLLLFTNDGELSKKLTHPSTGVYKIYQVELDRPLTHDDMRKIREGITLDDGPIAADDIQYAGTGEDKRIVGIELHSGRNRIVRRIFESLDYKIHKLDRVVFACLTKKDLPRGRWRELTEKEVGYLKMI